MLPVGFAGRHPPFEETPFRLCQRRKKRVEAEYVEKEEDSRKELTIRGPNERERRNGPSATVRGI